MICMGHFAALWDGCFACEEDGAGAFDAVRLGAIEPNAMWQELALFVSKAAGPCGLAVAFQKAFEGRLFPGIERHCGQCCCVVGAPFHEHLFGHCGSGSGVS